MTSSCVCFVGCAMGCSAGLVGCAMYCSAGLVGCAMDCSAGLVGCAMGCSAGLVGCAMDCSAGLVDNTIICGAGFVGNTIDWRTRLFDDRIGGSTCLTDAGREQFTSKGDFNLPSDEIDTTDVGTSAGEMRCSVVADEIDGLIDADTCDVTFCAIF